MEPEPAILCARLAALRWQTVGHVEHLFLCPAPDEHRAVRTLSLVPEEGVVGQYPGKQWWRGARVAGRQISCVSADICDALEIDPAVIGDNLIIRGLDLRTLSPGDVLRIGDALLTVTPTPHRPCMKLAERTSLPKMQAIKDGGWRGVLLDALRPGEVTLGDCAERVFLSTEGPA